MAQFNISGYCYIYSSLSDMLSLFCELMLSCLSCFIVVTVITYLNLLTLFIFLVWNIQFLQVRFDTGNPFCFFILVTRFCSIFLKFFQFNPSQLLANITRSSPRAKQVVIMCLFDGPIKLSYTFLSLPTFRPSYNCFTAQLNNIGLSHL